VEYIGHGQLNQCMHCGELRRGREAEKDKNLFIEKMIENV
jgi:hypothetical protein